MNSHVILVMFVVLFTKRLKLFTNARTPYALVHMMAMHTAFHNELVTWGSGCTWSLGHVHVHWDVLAGFHRAFYLSLLTGIDGPVRFKRASSEATRSPNARTTFLTMTSLLSFFEKRNGPPPPPAPLSPLPKLEQPVVYVYTCIGRAAHLFVL